MKTCKNCGHDEKKHSFGPAVYCSGTLKLACECKKFEEENVCVKCGKDVKIGFCHNCQRCYDCLKDKCEKFEEEIIDPYIKILDEKNHSPHHSSKQTVIQNEGKSSDEALALISSGDFNLSEKIESVWDKNFMKTPEEILFVGDVKTFIKKLKEVVRAYQKQGQDMPMKWFFAKLDELAGEDLR